MFGTDREKSPLVSILPKKKTSKSGSKTPAQQSGGSSNVDGDSSALPPILKPVPTKAPPTSTVSKKAPKSSGCPKPKPCPPPPPPHCPPPPPPPIPPIPPLPPIPPPAPSHCTPVVYDAVVVKEGDHIKVVDDTAPFGPKTFVVSSLPFDVKVDAETMQGNGVTEPISVNTFTGKGPGLVPGATTDDHTKFLRGDGEWIDPALETSVFYGDENTTFAEWKAAYTEGKVLIYRKLFNEGGRPILVNYTLVGNGIKDDNEFFEFSAMDETTEHGVTVAEGYEEPEYFNAEMATEDDVATALDEAKRYTDQKTKAIKNFVLFTARKRPGYYTVDMPYEQLVQYMEDDIVPVLRVVDGRKSYKVAMSSYDETTELFSFRMDDEHVSNETGNKRESSTIEREFKYGRTGFRLETREVKPAVYSVETVDIGV